MNAAYYFIVRKVLHPFCNVVKTCVSTVTSSALIALLSLYLLWKYVIVGDHSNHTNFCTGVFFIPFAIVSVICFVVNFIQLMEGNSREPKFMVYMCRKIGTFFTDIVRTDNEIEEQYKNDKLEAKKQKKKKKWVKKNKFDRRDILDLDED